MSAAERGRTAVAITFVFAFTFTFAFTLRRTLARFRRPRGDDDERALQLVLDALLRTHDRRLPKLAIVLVPSDPLQPVRAPEPEPFIPSLRRR